MALDDLSRCPEASCFGQRPDARLDIMSTIAEIEAAIEKLPVRQLEQLARWLEAYRQRPAAPPPVDNWLERARGAAAPGVTTQDVMTLTRGEE